MPKRGIDPVGLRDIAAMYPDNVSYQTLKEYSHTRRLPPPAAYVNRTSPRPTPVWHRPDIRKWAADRGWHPAVNIDRLDQIEGEQSA